MTMRDVHHVMWTRWALSLGMTSHEAEVLASRLLDASTRERASTEAAERLCDLFITLTPHNETL